jgi:hypothetical protein
MYGALPKNEKTFSIDIVGDTSGQQFAGQFSAKCVLNLAEKRSKELEKTRLLADSANPSNGLSALAEVLAQIRAKLTQWPDWWANLGHGADMLDENVVIHLYDKLSELETEWRNEIKKKTAKPEDSTGTSLGNAQKES